MILYVCVKLVSVFHRKYALVLMDVSSCHTQGLHANVQTSISRVCSRWSCLAVSHFSSGRYPLLAVATHKLLW